MFFLWKNTFSLYYQTQTLRMDVCFIFAEDGEDERAIYTPQLQSLRNNKEFLGADLSNFY